MCSSIRTGDGSCRESRRHRVTEAYRAACGGRAGVGDREVVGRAGLPLGEVAGVRFGDCQVRRRNHRGCPSDVLQQRKGQVVGRGYFIVRFPLIAGSIS